MNLLGILVAFIEWYDTAISIAFSNILSEIFFPNYNLDIEFNLALALVSISCIGKPIGAYIIGKYSDQKDRIQAAKASFIVMILCSLVLTIIPSYKKIGIISTVFFFLIKFIQGISIGGNYSTNVYSIEQSKNKYFVSSLTSFSIFLGFFIANSYNAICISYFSKNFTLKYAWRAGFLLTGIFAIPIFKILQQQNKLKNQKETNPQKKAPNELIQFIKTSFLVLLDIVPFQYFHVFLPNYRIMILNHDQSSVRIGTLTTLATINIITPIIGKLADMFGPMFFLQTSAFMMIFSSFFNKIGITFCIFTDIYFGIMMALCYGTLYSYILLKFNRYSRAKLSGLALNMTTSIILIIIPVLSQTIEKNINQILMTVGLICLIILIRESKKESENYAI